MGTNLKSFLFLAATYLLFVSPAAFGDWDPGDPNKMHWPQLPQLDGGWDVQILNQPPQAYNQLADDWMCTESGFIDEIHLWISWEYDSVDPIDEVRVRIYDDIPASVNPLGYSTPGNCISGQGDWVFKAVNGEFTVRPYGTGQQGWYDPLNSVCRPNDHQNCYQINITDIVNTLSTQEFADPVDQVQGNIYWISFRVIRTGDHLMGWKTSDDHFNDCAVWNKPIGGGQNQWTKLQDCISGDDLDLAFVINNEDTSGGDEREYGDAPEGSLAYPSLGTNGSFPTCKNVAVAGYIEHNNFGAYFGQSFDFELEGNAGNCPLFNPNTYNMDECFQDGDAGLIMPESFTIQGAVGSEAVVPCPGFTGTALGRTCAIATWGTDIDIDVHNHMPNQSIGYVNVLIDWNQDGQWNGSSSCSGTAVPEHVLVNWQIPNPYDGPLSGTMGAAPQTFQIGPNAGYVWARFSITEQPVAVGWDGSGTFEDGETEDYLLLIDSATGPVVKWSQPPVLHEEPDIYEGWDEWAHNQLPRMVADDWFCDSNKPVTAIRWWGSFENWQDNTLPPDLPKGFYLTIWNDIPAQAGGPADPCMKWAQPPDLTDYGMDVDATDYILADDFECRVTGKLTDITIWGSWKDDLLPFGQPYNPLGGDPMAVDFTLSIHKDIPASVSPTGYSMPGDVLWVWNMPAHSYNAGIFAYPIEEWWMEPMMWSGYFPGDTACFIYQFHIDPNDAFLQQGTQENPIVYWLDVQAMPQYPPSEFGWKTSETHWNDDAVWGPGPEPYVGPWEELTYPYQHPLAGDSIDLAFELITTPVIEPTYSHPNEILWENYCYTYDVKYYGQEYDPQTGAIELAKFEFYQEIDPHEYWEQPDDQGVYWLGIMALYDNDPCHGFGWETREHIYNDDAVRFFGIPTPGVQYQREDFEPIEWDSNSWDMSFELISDPCEEPDELDWGDAPDGPYPTLNANGGASHVIFPGMMLGATIDAEPDGQPDPQALGDDNNGLIPDDEDGVMFVSKLYPGNMARIDVVVADPTGTALLNAWIDYDGNGVWDASEQIATDMPVFNGVNKLYPTVPASAGLGQTFARFRLSTMAGLTPSGAAPDGEVEDYEVFIDQLVCDYPPDDPNWTKWVQMPDDTITGIDIRLDRNDGVLRVLADDFECNDPGPITDVHLWGSWLSDHKGNIQRLTISFYDDIPAWVNPDGYSKPGNLLWMRDFLPGEWEEKFYDYVDPGEWWWDTTTPMGIQFGDTEIWQYNICIDPTEAFIQEGTPSNPIVYWLAVKADLGLPIGAPEFGWKTSVDHWNDDAVVSHDDGGTWAQLGYPPNHELHGMGLTVDMAFAITGPNECYTGPDYLEWAAVGKPISWCDPRQCHGDATNSENGDPKLGYYWVQEGDLGILINGWKKDGPLLGDYNPALDPTGWIAADFTHSENGDPKLGYYRVQEGDLGILINYWKCDNPAMGPDPANMPEDCLQ